MFAFQLSGLSQIVTELRHSEVLCVSGYLSNLLKKQIHNIIHVINNNDIIHSLIIFTNQFNDFMLAVFYCILLWYIVARTC